MRLPVCRPLARIQRSERKLVLLLALGLLIGLIGGCSSSSETYRVDEGDLAERYLPTTQRLDHHPDSVQAVTITEEDDRLKYESSRSYPALWRKWSSTYRTIGTGRARQQPLSYATFWGLELSLASLRAEGAFSLTKDRARDLVETRRKENQSIIQIDVVWFASEGRTDLTGPGAQVELVIGKEKYRAEKEDQSPLREAFLDSGQTGLYRRNIFYFPRVVDGEDILNGVDEIALEVRPTSAGGDRVQFRWTWDMPQASRRDE
jgi:hypothetical protein